MVGNKKSTYKLVELKSLVDYIKETPVFFLVSLSFRDIHRIRCDIPSAMSLRDFVNGRAPQTIRGILIVKGIRCIFFGFIDPRNSLCEYTPIPCWQTKFVFPWQRSKRWGITRLPLFIENSLSVLDGTNLIIILIMHHVREWNEIKDTFIPSKRIFYDMLIKINSRILGIRCNISTIRLQRRIKSLYRCFCIYKFWNPSHT